MSKKINLYLIKEDLNDFDKFLSNEFNCIYVLRKSSRNDIEIVEKLIDMPFLSGYILHNSMLTDLKLTKVDNNLYFIDSAINPVIEYSQGMIKNNIIEPTRLLFHKGYFDNSNKWVDFSPFFCEWCDDLFKKLKKKYTKTINYNGKKYLIGDNAFRKLESKEFFLDF